MNRKVWVISERDWQQSDSRPDRQKNRLKATAGNNVKKQKSPAAALTLSLFVWGGGHVYIGRYRSGLLLFAAMLLALGAMAGTTLEGLDIPAALLFPVVLCISFYASVDAYLDAVDKRTDPFGGIDNEYCSFLASLVLPGWGQFLNGQAGKGIFYGVFGLLGYVSIFVLAAASRLWHLPTAGADLTRLELPLMIVLFLMPLLLLTWIMSVHDAYWICKYPRLKKPLKERARFVLERIRRRGIIKGLFRELRGLVLLTLLLGCVLAAAGASLSTDAYAPMFTNLAGEMEIRGMRIIPGFLNGLVK